MANLTITLDPDLLRRARSKATADGTSLSAVVGGLLADYVGPSRAAVALAELLELAAASDASSGPEGRTWTRDELYDRPRLR